MLRCALHRLHTPFAVLRIMTLRIMILMIMLIGFGGQVLLTAASLPRESPRAALLRLTGIDIAPIPAEHFTPTATDTKPDTPQHTSCHHNASATAYNSPALSHHLSHLALKDGAASSHHTHHHGADCALCPLLAHIIFALTYLIYVLQYRQQKRRLWQQTPPAHAPPKPCQPRPPSRGPPISIHALYVH